MPLLPAILSSDDGRILDLTSSLGPVSLTRASSGTYNNAYGVNTSVGNDVARFDNDLSTLVARTNYLRNSAMAGLVDGTPGTSPTNWGVALRGLSITRTAVTVNGNPGYKFRVYGTPSSSGQCYVSMETTTGIPVTVGDTILTSAYFSLDAGNWTNVTSPTLLANIFDSTPTWLSGSGGASLASLTSSTTRLNIAPFTATNAATAYAQPLFSFDVTNGAAVDFTVTISAPMLEKGVASPTAFISTSGSASTVYDALATPRGLLIETTRSNLFLNSETPATQSITVSATSYALSFRGTGSIVATGAASFTLAGTGPNTIVSQVFTATAGTLTLTLSGSVLKPQLETRGAANSFVTSYIPSGASAATRASDIVVISNLSSFGFNPAQGTFVVEAQVLPGNTNPDFQPFISLNDGSNNNELYLANVSSTRGACSLYAGGVDQGYMASAVGAWTLGTVGKIALSYDSSSRHMSVNGGAVVDETGDTFPTFTRMSIGLRGSGTSQLSGWIRKITYYPYMKNGTELKALSA